MWKDNFVFYKSKCYFIIFVQVLAFTKSLVPSYQHISLTRCILTVEPVKAISGVE